MPHDRFERVVNVGHSRLLYYSSCQFICVIAFLIIASIHMGGKKYVGIQ